MHAGQTRHVRFLHRQQRLKQCARASILALQASRGLAAAAHRDARGDQILGDDVGCIRSSRQRRQYQPWRDRLEARLCRQGAHISGDLLGEPVRLLRILLVLAGEHRLVARVSAITAGAQQAHGQNFTEQRPQHRPTLGGCARHRTGPQPLAYARPSLHELLQGVIAGDGGAVLIATNRARAAAQRRAPLSSVIG